MRPPLALLLALLALPAAADPPKSASASRFGRQAMLEEVFWKVVDASKDPEFLVWYEGAPVSEELRFEYSETEKHIGFSCQPYGPTAGSTPALATFCQETPVVAFGSGFFSYAVTKDEWALVSGHELAHLLFRHPETRATLHAKKFAAWRKGWLAGPEGTKWKTEVLGKLTEAAEASGLKVTPETMAGVMEVKFLESAGGQEYLDAVREQEAQADQWGAKLAAVAGFKTSAGLSLYRRKAQEAQVSGDFSLEQHYPADIRAYELKLNAEPGSLWIPPALLTDAKKP
jgi:predicted Zn-dependent protease